MYRLAVYGKGGVGKSTVSANLSYLLSAGGSTVLQVGCDPKHDSTRLLTGGRQIRTFHSDTSADPLVVSDCGVMCVECGGAEPGRGCAGKGMELLFSRIADVDADYRVCDVLGDVVCGGFSIPARKSNADAVLIVTSGEFMSLFAANNILRGLRNINPGPCVIGIVLNRRGDEGEEASARAFSEAVGVPIVCDIPRSREFRDAEAAGSTVASLYPDSVAAEAMRSLATFVASHPEGFEPKPLSEESMSQLARGEPITGGERRRNQLACSFDSYDSERNLSYVGEFVMPACTSHGAADAAMRIRDAAVILHGPVNCAYLMEMAFRRRALNDKPQRSPEIPDPGIFSTHLDASEAFRDTGSNVSDAVARAKAEGYSTMFLVATCSSEIMGADLAEAARRASKEHGVDVIHVEPDREFLSSKFGASYGLFDALICRMPPRDVEEGTVNLIARSFYGMGRDRNAEAIDHILGLMGLRTKFRLLDFCDMADVMDFRAAEYDVRLGRGMLDERVCRRISEVTGRREALLLEPPSGLGRCLEWVHLLAEYDPKLAPRAPAAEAALREEFESIVSAGRGRMEGKRVVIYAIMARRFEWQVETLRAMGAEVVGILMVHGHVIDHNAPTPDYGDIPVTDGARMCDLRRLMSEGGIDLVVTNDPDRVGREGYRWVSLGSRHVGMTGVAEWVRSVTEALGVPGSTWEAGL
ncbi:MAG: nitrogenase component 1 [Thermoplasmata archaeon]|nr:nitrogenase component 1 [Thermoplasmata archaeon]